MRILFDQGSILDIHKELASLIEIGDATGERAPSDGRTREDDRRAAHCRASREACAGTRPLLTSNANNREKERQMAKDKFIIEPHFRLQEWVAEEKGYFKQEGLDYVFRELIKSTDGAHHYRGDKVGAMQSFEKGRSSDVSCACHWTVGVAASKGKGRLYADVYSVAPSGVFVPADSPVKTPEDLAR